MTETPCVDKILRLTGFLGRTSQWTKPYSRFEKGRMERVSSYLDKGGFGGEAAHNMQALAGSVADTRDSLAGVYHPAVPEIQSHLQTAYQHLRQGDVDAALPHLAAAHKMSAGIRDREGGLAQKHIASHLNSLGPAGVAALREHGGAVGNALGVQAPTPAPAIRVQTPSDMLAEARSKAKKLSLY